MHDRLIALELDRAVADVSEVRDYWLLLKPNVMSLVVFSAAAGLYLAPGTLHPLLMAGAILCIAVAAGAAGAINNSYDADIDRVMARTRRRPTASGRIRPDDARLWLVTRGEMIVIMAGRLSGLGLSSSVSLYQIGGDMEDSIHSSTVSDRTKPPK